MFQTNSFLLSLSLVLPSYYAHRMPNIRNKRENSWEPNSTLSFVLPHKGYGQKMPESKKLSQAIPEDGEPDQVEVHRPDQDAGVTLFAHLL